MKYFNSTRHLLFFLVGITLAGCSGSTSDTSSGYGSGPAFSSATAFTSTSGSLINVIYDEPIIAGQPHTFYFQIRPQGATPGVTTGTVHWGDGTASRIRDDHSMAVTHTFSAALSHPISAIQIDGETVEIITMSTGEISAVSESGTVSSDGAGSFLFSGFRCSPTQDTAIIPISSPVMGFPRPWADGSTEDIDVSISLGCAVPRLQVKTVSPGGVAGGPPPGSDCMAGDTYTIAVTHAGGDTASCSWLVTL